MKRSTGLVGLLLAGACATSGVSSKPPTQQDTADVPEAMRPGYGNAELHTWWPLTPPETEALRGWNRRGRATRTPCSRWRSPRRAISATPPATRRTSSASTSSSPTVKPTIDGAADEWHRGYELHRAMHRAFFPGEKAELGGYDFYQSRITGIFTGGHYNCLSSARAVHRAGARLRHAGARRRRPDPRVRRDGRAGRQDHRGRDDLGDGLRLDSRRALLQGAGGDVVGPAAGCVRRRWRSTSTARSSSPTG